MYIAAKNAQYSEINAITVRECNFGFNERIGLVIGEETRTYDENEGYGVNVYGCHFSNNGIGNLQVSGARVVIS
jgi:hypothetical protein